MDLNTINLWLVFFQDRSNDYPRKIYDVKGDNGEKRKTWNMKGAEREKMLKELHLVCKEVSDLLDEILFPATNENIINEDCKDVL